MAWRSNTNIPNSRNAGDTGEAPTAKNESNLVSRLHSVTPVSLSAPKRKSVDKVKHGGLGRAFRRTHTHASCRNKPSKHPPKVDANLAKTNHRHRPEPVLTRPRWGQQQDSKPNAHLRWAEPPRESARQAVSLCTKPHGREKERGSLYKTSRERGNAAQFAVVRTSTVFVRILVVRQKPRRR